MAYIAGLSESTKATLKEICREKRITQVEWVEQKINEDVKALTPNGKEAKALAK